MDLQGVGTIVSGGASGLGGATVRELVARGARVAILDRDADKANALAAELGDATLACPGDVTNEEEVQTAVDGAVEAFGGIRFAAACAGIGWAQRTVTKEGPAILQPFETVIQVNLIGSFNVLRIAAAAMAKQRARRGRRAWSGGDDRLDRRLRRPDRADRLLGLQGRGRRG